MVLMVEGSYSQAKLLAAEPTRIESNYAKWNA